MTLNAKIAALAASLLLCGCDVVSPFVTDEMMDTRMDVDGDGISRPNDCDDHDDTVGGPDGWFRDVDNDGFGAGEQEFHCDKPEGYVALSGDCDDTEELVNPDIVEICNGIDDDCDEAIDEDVVPRWYLDDDSDTYGDPEAHLDQCSQPSDYVANADDCDDSDNLVHPDATEICDDLIDQDCNDLVDDADESEVWFADTDMDSFGDPNSWIYSCQDSVEGYVLDDQDCDDTNMDVSPAVNEACEDGIDNDCDGVIDTDAVDTDWYRDADEDGYGNPDETTLDCAPPSGYVANAGDCDDALTQVNPEAEEICNDGLDNNCNGSPDACELSGTISLTAADAKITGSAEGDEAGNSLVDLGDVDGDGYSDIAIAAQSYGPNDQGAVAVFYGPSFPSTDLALAGTIFLGEASDDKAGYKVGAPGDVDNDGFSDILISAPYNDRALNQSGTVYLFYGPFPAGTVALSTADVMLTGEQEQDFAGFSLASGCDVNIDGYSDIMIGVTGQDAYGDNTGAAYLFLGPIEAGEYSLAEADTKFTGEQGGDYAGISIACNGDTNNDGNPDILIGAFDESSASNDAGAVYLFLGPATDPDINLSAADTKFTGVNTDDQAGRWVGFILDINGDGCDEVMFGVYQSDMSYNDAGATHVFYGPTPTGTVSATLADITFVGEATDDLSGLTAYGRCDINRDGVTDVTIGAINHSSAGSDAGALYVFYGGTGLSGTISLALADAKFNGESSDDKASSAIGCTSQTPSGYKNVLLVGAYRESSVGYQSGAVYLIYGLGY